MLDSWSSEIYRIRAVRWRQEADLHPPGEERDACLVLAGGYENLAEFIDQSGGSRAVLS